MTTLDFRTMLTPCHLHLHFFTPPQVLDISGNGLLAAAAAGPSARLQQLGADTGWLARSTAFLSRLPVLATLYLEGGASETQRSALMEALSQEPPQLAELVVAGVKKPWLRGLARVRPALRITQNEEQSRGIAACASRLWTPSCLPLSSEAQQM